MEFNPRMVNFGWVQIQVCWSLIPPSTPFKNWINPMDSFPIPPLSSSRTGKERYRFVQMRESTSSTQKPIQMWPCKKRKDCLAIIAQWFSNLNLGKLSSEGTRESRFLIRMKLPLPTCQSKMVCPGRVLWLDWSKRKYPYRFRKRDHRHGKTNRHQSGSGMEFFQLWKINRDSMQWQPIHRISNQERDGFLGSCSDFDCDASESKDG